MSVNDVFLPGGMRDDLLNLQMVSALQARSSLRLSTGKRVNSAVDDPQAFFAAQAESSRANDLASLKNLMGEAIQVVKAATQGVDAITSLIQQAKGLTASAQSASTADRATLATQFDNLRTQIDQLAGDAGYNGTNLLTAGTITVSFNETGTSSVTVTGFDATTTGLNIAASANNWAGNADIAAAATDLTNALATLRTNATGLAANNSVISSRQDFTSNLVNTLVEGANNLTAADPNQEGANLTALQTRTQLGIVALSLTNQSQQALLRLF